MERRSNRAGGIPAKCQYVEYQVEMGTSAANSHHGQQYPLHKQPECKAANSSNLHHAKTCSPRADHVSTLSGRRGFKTLTTQERKLLRRRQAIEPIIGHLKADHRMARCHLKGEQGDRLHAVLCAAGYNLRWLLRMIAKRGCPSCGGFICACARQSHHRPTGLACCATSPLTHSGSRRHDWSLAENEYFRADDVGLDELGCHQAHGVPHCPELARPVMSAAASLHAQQTRRQVDEECRHLAPAQLLLHEHLAMLVDSVDLEHVLRQVDANSRKLHGGRPFSVQVVDQRLHFGTSMPLRVGAFIPLLTVDRGHGSSGTCTTCTPNWSCETARALCGKLGREPGWEFDGPEGAHVIHHILKRHHALFRPTRSRKSHKSQLLSARLGLRKTCSSTGQADCAANPRERLRRHRCAA